MILRDYQVAALADTWDYFTRETGNPLVVLPTGAGKSLYIAEWCRGVLSIDPGARILIMAHVRELVGQNYAELVNLWPEAPAGIYSAGLKRRDIGARILFGGIQSLHRRALQVQQCDILIIDEAHLVPRDTATMYGRFITELRELNPAMKVIGTTATPYRTDSGLLYGEKDSIFDTVAHETPVRSLIDQGYLAPLIGRTRKDAEVDTTGVHTRLGDFVAGELAEAAKDPAVIEKMADDIVANGADRRGWLFFGCSIEHCELMATALRERGISTAVITKDTPSEERKEILDAYKRMEIRCLSSMGVLTTGFNAKHVDLIALARPTKSTGLYIQMCGRGTRCIGANIEESKANGKANCLVLDYGGNIRRHGPFDEPFDPGKKKAKNADDEPGDMPMKVCPECQNEVMIASRMCPACNFEFPEIVKKVSTEKDYAPILAPPPMWLQVDEVSYSEHYKPLSGKPPSMKVTYRCGMQFHYEWICFEHSGYAKEKAKRWWLTRARCGQAPETVQEALQNVRRGFISEPTGIQVSKDGKWSRIKSYRFGEGGRDDLPAMPETRPGLRLFEPAG